MKAWKLRENSACRRATPSLCLKVPTCVRTAFSMRRARVACTSRSGRFSTLPARNPTCLAFQPADFRQLMLDSCQPHTHCRRAGDLHAATMIEMPIHCLKPHPAQLASHEHNNATCCSGSIFHRMASGAAAGCEHDPEARPAQQSFASSYSSPATGVLLKQLFPRCQGVT